MPTPAKSNRTKPAKAPARRSKATPPPAPGTIKLTAQQAEYLRLSMGAKTPAEALQKAVELATKGIK